MGDLATQRFNEKSTPKLTWEFRDSDNVKITKARLTAITVWLYVKSGDATIINSRNAQAALDANGFTTATNGDTTWQMVAADNAIISDANPYGQGIEVHRCEIDFTYDSGVGRGAARMDIEVVRFLKRT